MKLSDAGAHLIESYEGFVPYPYRDTVGVWTIGFGSTKGVGPWSPHVTRQQAHDRLIWEVNAHYAAAIDALRLPLNQFQFDALVSFVYNVGTGGVAPSTGVGRALLAHDWHAATNCLLQWDKAGGRRLAGLTRRRQAERALFLRTPRIDALDGYRDDEKRWIREYEKLRRSGEDPERVRVLRTVMRKRRKLIWVAAQPEPRGSGGGWDVAKRRERYRSLLSRTLK
jgi:GH24 family phage-related lysozyme (muramidase)